MSARLIDRFAPVLCGHLAPVVRDPGLLMEASGSMKAYYTSFDCALRFTQPVRSPLWVVLVQSAQLVRGLRHQTAKPTP